MGRFGIKDVIALHVQRRTEEGEAVVSAALRTRDGVIAKRVKITRFGWINTGLLMTALDKGDDMAAEDAAKVFGDSMKGFEPVEEPKTTEEIKTASEGAATNAGGGN